MFMTFIVVTMALCSGAGRVGMDGEVPRVPLLREGGSFWTPRLHAIRHGTLDANRHQSEITGRLANFDRAGAKLAGAAEAGKFEGLLFNDSDVYKMMEGWAWAVAAETDPARRAALDRDLDELIVRIRRAQLPDGYINTYYTLKEGLDKRFSREEWDHETYCLGHLIEAGVGHAEALGKRELLAMAIKAGDYLDRLYEDTEKGFSAPPGHQEAELALVRLGEFTGETRYVRLAKKLIDLRGRPHRKPDGTMYGPWGDYAQDHQPAAEQREAVGHAVRAAYFYAAMTDLARVGYPEYQPAVTALWKDITQRRVFVTGGIGPSGHNEGFTIPYDIPTRGAYQETCASIALCLFAHRMFELTGDASYMEQFETTLYNAALAGVSLKGDRFFYVNPMECTPGASGRGAAQRVEWFACACCPPNMLRFFGQLGRYAYGVRDGVVYVNLPVGGEATVAVPGGGVRIVQRTDYPWTGGVEATMHNTSGSSVTVAVRRGAGYERLTLAAGDEVTRRWEIPLPVTRVFADARVKASVGKVAIKRGPMVYAVESVDTGGPLGSVYLPSNAEVVEVMGLDGVPVLRAKAMRAKRSVAGKGLYELVPGTADAEPVELTMRPYFMWANRGPAEMRMWIPESPQFVDRIPETPASMAGVKASVSSRGNGDGPEAAHDGLASESSADMDIPRMTYWPRKGEKRGAGGKGGTEEWIQYTFDRPREMNGLSVLWFDDTGVGECRVPESCIAEYLEGNEWKAVPTMQNGEPGAVGVAKDQMNTLGFHAVMASSIRLRLVLREGFSAGVLEWTVTGPS